MRKSIKIIIAMLTVLIPSVILMVIFFITQPINFYSSYQGLLTPMDGSYNDWVYNTMTVIDNKVVYTFNHPQTHWNGAGDQGTTLGIYDPKTGKSEYKEITYNDEVVTTHTGWISNNVYYVMNKDNIYYTEDLGDKWKHNTAQGLTNEPNYLYQLNSGRLLVVYDKGIKK